MTKIQRPKSISIITIIAIVLVLLAFPMLFMPSIKKMGDFVPLILGVIITLQFISLIGIWHMKKWGVLLFIIIFCARVVTFIFLDIYTFRFYFNIFYSLLFSFFFIAHYRKMNSNL